MSAGVCMGLRGQPAYGDALPRRASGPALRRPSATGSGLRPGAAPARADAAPDPRAAAPAPLLPRESSAPVAASPKQEWARYGASLPTGRYDAGRAPAPGGAPPPRRGSFTAGAAQAGPRPLQKPRQAPAAAPAMPRAAPGARAGYRAPHDASRRTSMPLAPAAQRPGGIPTNRRHSTDGVFPQGAGPAAASPALRRGSCGAPGYAAAGPGDPAFPRRSGSMTLVGAGAGPPPLRRGSGSAAGADPTGLRGSGSLTGSPTTAGAQRAVAPPSPTEAGDAGDPEQDRAVAQWMLDFLDEVVCESVGAQGSRTVTGDGGVASVRSRTGV